MNLTFQEENILNTLIYQYNINPLTQILVKKYYLHHKQEDAQSSYSHSQISDYLKCSLIVSQKCNFTQTISGKIVTGFIYSFNQILKQKNNYQKLAFLDMLENFLLIIQVKNNIIKEEINLLLQETRTNLQNSILFKKAFENFLNKSQKQSVLNKKLIKFGWILYLDAKQSISEQFQNEKKIYQKFLMASVTYIILKNGLQVQNLLNMQLSQFKQLLQIKEDRLVIPILLKLIFQYYEIETYQVNIFKDVSLIFDSYFDNLIINGTISYQVTGENIFFIRQELVQCNQYLIIKKYLNNAQFHQIDFINFISQNDPTSKQHNHFQIQKKKRQKKSKQNQRLTEINQKQTEIYQKQTKLQEKNSHFQSHRVLNLQTHIVQSVLYQNQYKCKILSKNQQSMDDNSKKQNKRNCKQLLYRLNFPENVILQKTNNLSLKQKRQIQKYILKNSTSYFQKEIKEKPFNQFISKMIEKCLKIIISTQQKCFQFMEFDKVKFLIYQLFCVNLDSLYGKTINQMPNFVLNQTHTMYKSILVSAFDIVLLKYNLSKKVFQTIIRIIMPKESQIFYVYFCLSQINITKPIKDHLQNRISQILNQYIWRDLQLVQQIQIAVQNFSYEQQTQNDELFCIFNTLKTHLIQLSQKVFIRVSEDHNQENIQELLNLSIQIFMKIILCFPKIIYKRNAFQILICSNYLSSKICRTNIKFTYLIEIYNQIFFKEYKKCLQIKQKLFHQINCGNETINIIDFYNNEFLQKARTSLLIQNVESYYKFNLALFQPIHFQNILKKNLVLSPCSIYNSSQQYLQNKKEQETKQCQVKQFFEFKQNILNMSQKHLFKNTLPKIRQRKDNSTHLQKHNQSLFKEQDNQPFYQLNCLNSYQQSKTHQRINQKQNSKDANIFHNLNLQFNRDPTRIKSRNNIDNQVLCNTKKASKFHPIFDKVYQI